MCCSQHFTTYYYKIYIIYINTQNIQNIHKSARFSSFPLSNPCTEQREKDVFVIFALLQETKNSNLFDKNCPLESVKCHIQQEESWLGWIVNEQVNYK